MPARGGGARRGATAEALEQIAPVRRIDRTRMSP